MRDSKLPIAVRNRQRYPWSLTPHPKLEPLAQSHARVGSRNLGCGPLITSSLRNEDRVGTVIGDPFHVGPVTGHQEALRVLVAKQNTPGPSVQSLYPNLAVSQF